MLQSNHFINLCNDSNFVGQEITGSRRPGVFWCKNCNFILNGWGKTWGGWVPLSLMFPDFGIGHLTHVIKWAKSQKDKKGREDQFWEGSWVSPPPFRSDLSFWPFFPNGISFVGKFLTSFGLIISLYKFLKRNELPFALRADIFSSAGVLSKPSTNFRWKGCRWGAMRLEIPRFSHSLFFLSEDTTPTPRPAPRHLPTRDNSPPFLSVF